MSARDGRFRVTRSARKRYKSDMGANGADLGPAAAEDGAAQPEKTAIHDGTPVRLRELGYDEKWLHDWLTTEPGRLGLGDVAIVERELTQKGGGYLDILARQDKTFFSIEVQL